MSVVDLYLRTPLSGSFPVATFPDLANTWRMPMPKFSEDSSREKRKPPAHQPTASDTWGEPTPIKPTLGGLIHG